MKKLMAMREHETQLFHALFSCVIHSNLQATISTSFRHDLRLEINRPLIEYLREMK